MAVETSAFEYIAAHDQQSPDAAELLEGCLRLMEASSLVDLERRLDAWLAQTLHPIAWTVVCRGAGAEDPLVQMEGGRPLEHRPIDQGPTLTFPLRCGDALGGNFEL